MLFLPGMKTNLSNSLSASSRVWIYAADRIFSSVEANQIDAMAKDFATQWSAHKVQLAADGALLYNCFLVLMADESISGASGCSIDSSVRFVKEIGAKFQADFFNRKLLYEWSESGELKIHPFAVAAEKHASGELHSQSKVFNHLVSSKADLQSRWLVTLAESPLNHFFTAPQAAFNLSL